MTTLWSRGWVLGCVALAGCMDTEVPLAEADLAKGGLQTEAESEAEPEGERYESSYGWDFVILPSNTLSLPCDLDPDTPPPDCHELGFATWHAEGCQHGICWEALAAGKLDAVWFAGSCWLPEQGRGLRAGWTLAPEGPDALHCTLDDEDATVCEEEGIPTSGTIRCTGDDDLNVELGLDLCSVTGSATRTNDAWFVGRCWPE